MAFWNWLYNSANWPIAPATKVVCGASGADHINVVLDRTGCGEPRVASPDGKGNDLRAVKRELSRHLGKEPVEADHDANLSESRASSIRKPVRCAVLIPQKLIRLRVIGKLFGLGVPFEN